MLNCAGDTFKMLLSAHPLVQKHQRLQEVVDAGADLLRRQAVQQQLQRLHPLRHQVDAPPVLHRAGQEAQQTRVPQGLQVLQEMKSIYFLPVKSESRAAEGKIQEQEVIR